MPTVLAEGTQLATVGTEHYLVSDNSQNKVFVFEVDTAYMALGDIVELRILTRVRSSTPPRVVYSSTYAHPQGDANKYSVPVPSDVSFTATLKQTAGTGRSFDWKVLTIP